jgi:transcriptional regulator of arginine metabolism
MSKAYRQEQILKCIRSRQIGSQADLATALRRAGVEISQVTLSRDLKELGLVKTPNGYSEMSAPGATPPAPQIGHILRDFVRDLRRAQNLLVMKTEPGSAPTVGAAIDNEGWDELVGSLAGDDTLLLICEDGARCQTMDRRLRSLLRE